MRRSALIVFLATLPAGNAEAQTIAKISSDATNIQLGDVVTVQVDMTPESDGRIWCGLEIKFGDGESRTLRVGNDDDAKELPIRLKHTYANPGEYAVQLEGKSVSRGLKSAGACSGPRQDLKLVVGGSIPVQVSEPQAPSLVKQTQPVSPQALSPVAKAPVAAVQVQVSPSPSEPATLEKLDSCMKKQMFKGAAVGALAGGLLGALFGGDKDKGKTMAIGASMGAAAGGAIAWQGSYKSCTTELNLATVSSRRTADYKETATRYDYQGTGTILKIEGGELPPKIVAGQVLNADLKYALLTSDAAEVDVQVARAFQCGTTKIPVQQERYKAAPGTIVSTGRIQIPSASKDIGEQACSMWIGVAAAGQKDEWQGKFVIVPN